MIWGGAIYNIKYKNITQREIESYIKIFADRCSIFIEKWMKNYNNLALTFIPSGRQIPELLSKSLATKYNLPLESIIIKKDGFTPSKGINTCSESLKNAFDKYEIADNVQDYIYIIIDDVVGYGGSLIATSSKLKQITNKINYFICVAKDKR